MTVYQLLAAWLEPVHQITGLSGEVFCVVGFMAWAFSQLSSYAVLSDKPSLRTAISSAMLVAYVFVPGLSMLLFFDHEQILKQLNQGSPVLYFMRHQEQR